MKHLQQLVIGYLLVASTSISFSMDNSHFYRASFFNGEPRLEKPWLFTGELAITGGNTTCARNSSGKKVPLLDLFGKQKLQFLGENVPGLDPQNSLDAILLALHNNPTSQKFGRLSLSARFDIFEQILAVYQNLCSGFFLHAYVPMRKISVTGFRWRDCTPLAEQTIAWQTLLQSLDAILARYDMCIRSFSKTAMGDLTLLAGWTLNYEDTDYLDFIDATIQTGVLFPTGKNKSLHNVLDMPSGYDGHYALPIMLDASIGLYEWLTLGIHGDSLIFFNRTAIRHLKTSRKTNGFIQLAQAPTRIHSGALCNAAVYLKADHFLKGLSLLLGYTYSNKKRDTLRPCIPGFNETIINSDSLLFGWRMHTLNLSAEYDFATESHPCAPRIGIVYNRVFGGRRIFTTPILGSSISVDVSWCY